jgi:excinuclease UvrABC ATPase subunit
MTLVYVLDEPTTGLHLADVEQLLAVLDRLLCAFHDHYLRLVITAPEVWAGGLDHGATTGSTRQWRW